MKEKTIQKKKMKLKKSVIFKGLALITAILSLSIFIMFLKLNVLPFKYLFILLCILLGIDGILFFFVSRKNYKARILGTFLCIIFSILFLVGFKYQSATLNFLENIDILNIQTESYHVIVLKESPYKKLSDLQNKNISYVGSRETTSVLLKKLEESITFSAEILNDGNELLLYLEQNKVDAILLEEEELNIYYELKSEYKDMFRILDTIEVSIEKETIGKNVKITEEPFSVYITGIDTYGGLTKVSRSDVNMVLTVNPKTHKILLTSIPRDYYVQIDGTVGLKDKLTHAGLKGVNTSIKTISNLLETDINYYIKINFTSLVQIVDAIGGITVENPFEFTADYEEDTGAVYYVFPKGEVHLDGLMALAYVRERYGLREGDIARARHQQQVIEGMIKKLTSTQVLTKYTKLLSSIEGNFATNLSLKSITDFIQKQLETNPEWEISRMVLTGSDARELTNSFPTLYSAVMIPNESSVKEAIEKINSITN